MGDVITKVNDIEISKILKKQEKYINASNPYARLRNMYGAVFNGPTDNVTIEFIRGNEVKTKNSASIPI